MARQGHCLERNSILSKKREGSVPKSECVKFCVQSSEYMFKQRLKTAFLLFFATLFLFTATFTIASSARADSYGLDTAAQGTPLIPKTTTPQVIIGTIVGAVLSFLGVIFFLLIFYGGLRWMLAQGNDQEVDKAKQIIVAATIGLIIVLAAYAITAFIGQQLLATG